MTNLDTLAVPTKWSLEDALELIRALQPQTRQFNYHLCLGGGVMNEGHSEKDLDLYFLPLNTKQKPPQPTKLLEWLAEMWGLGEPIGWPNYPEAGMPYIHRIMFKYGQQRIDVFVLGSEEDVKRAQAEAPPVEETDVPTEAPTITADPGQPIRWEYVGQPGRVAHWNGGQWLGENATLPATPTDQPMQAVINDADQWTMIPMDGRGAPTVPPHREGRVDGLGRTFYYVAANDDTNDNG